MNELLKQIKPCDLEKPYIFISYSSADADLVFEDVLHFQQLGYNVWLDELNLDKTKASWKEDAISAIAGINCELVVLYVSRNSLISVPCFNEMKSTISEDAMDLHFGPVKFIAVDAEPIGDIQEFAKRIHENVRFSDASTEVRAAQAKTVSCFLKTFFNSNNEKVRVHPKQEKNRKLDYYQEIIASFPDRTRLFRPELSVVEKIIETKPVFEEQIIETEKAEKQDQDIEMVKAPDANNHVKVMPEELQKFEVEDGEFIIPEGYTAFNIYLTTSIFKKIRAANRVKKVVLPSTFRQLRAAEFSDCVNLKNVILSESIIDIPWRCFAGCSSLEHIEISNSVCTIQDEAFLNCSSLKKVVLSKRITGISKYMFGGCGKLESIVVYPSVKTIGEGAFRACKALKKVSLPLGVKTLKSLCFADCGSLEISIPSSVGSIADFAFDNTDVTIYCEENSYAQEFAKKHGYFYRIMAMN